MMIMVWYVSQAKAPGDMLQRGYELLDLEQHAKVVEQQHDSQALLGWGRQGIVLAFRGTASFQNLMSDVRVWHLCRLLELRIPPDVSARG